MKTGKIIFLNGVTSTGKTSIANAIQNKDSGYYNLSNDMFHGLEKQMLDMRARSEWKADFQHSVYLAESLVLMYHTAKTLTSVYGTNVIIDGMLYEIDAFITKYGKPHYDIMLEILAAADLFIVEVFCPLDICRQRNIARGDRGVNKSQEQYDLMNRHIRYDFRVDTSKNSAEDCAADILATVQA
jgi:adenylylsulfate kinase/chloramphenicol 3-O phosphotransferase